jgi:class 3 adenylate cyclase/predicted ATPase
MACSNCGTQNEAGLRFCNECGTSLTAACPSCGAANRPGARFCGGCGARLPGAPGGDDRPVLAPVHVAERRLVSVLFADLVGFTPYAEERDAEDVRETLTRYFELASTVMGRYGGTVEKFIGDAVMAVWGAPTAHEDDAERAVRAGLDLVDAVRALGPAVQARAGVMSGEAVVTLGASGQGMVAGDLVNTASRLQTVAPPGSVLVGEATMRLASEAIAFEKAGEQLLRGKAAPVPAWRALRVVARRGGRDRVETLEPLFVGRDDELRLLKELFHATCREGRARLVSVVGPTGLGKSRLAWELAKYVDGLSDTVFWHDGRSPAYGDGITFWALGEMVRGRCGLLETDDEATTRAKVAEAVAVLVPDPAELRRVERALLALLGFERAGPASDELFSAWRTFFERLAAIAPVVLAFEDLHHADPGLLDFVEHLLDWSRGAPILVVTLARPDLLERRPTWGAGKRAFTSLVLDPLPAPAMRQLLAGLVPGLPEAAVRSIIDRAEGVPLYAVETVRALIADGRLAPRDGGYAPVGDLSTLAVPETLVALVASRLDGLRPEERALVSDAAVLGQSFTPPALAAVSGIAEPGLEPLLRALVRRELLVPVADPQHPEHGQYAFVQALIREVAYNTLARADRKARHLAAARYLESVGGDELAGAVAGQFLAAQRNAPAGPEADALASQARIALTGAADRAAGLGSHAQAVAYLEQAVAITPDRDEAALLHERAAESARKLDRYDDAEGHLRAALERHVATADRAAQARATAALGRVLLDAIQVEKALALMTETSERLGDLGEEPELVALNGQLARAHLIRGDDRTAVGAADRVLEIAEPLGLVEIIAEALVTRGTALAALGQRYEGIAVLEAGQKLAAAHGLGYSELRAINNLVTFAFLDDPRAGLEACRSGLAVAHRLGEGSSNFLDRLTDMEFRIGDWDMVASLVERRFDEETEALGRAEALVSDIVLRAYRGEPTEALVADLEELAAGLGDPLGEIFVRSVRSEVAFAAARYDEARRENRRLSEAFPFHYSGVFLAAAHYRLLARDREGTAADLEEVERAPEARSRVVDAGRTTIRAGLAALDGDTAASLRLYRKALRAWRDLGLAWDEALCALDMATLLDPTHPEVRVAAEAGRETLVRLRARPFLDRLDAALARDIPVASA